MSGWLRRIDPARLPAALRRPMSREVHLWLGAWLRDRARKLALPRASGRTHVLFAVCDHFEPLHGRASRETGLARVRAWRAGLPALTRGVRDSGGRPPRHTFFFPGEEYDADFVAPLAELVDEGLAEVEVHLHHDGDTRETLRRKLEDTLLALGAHGVLPRRAGRPAWSFIHGNWALANGRRDGRWCGVDDELDLLFELGCYADFTFPSAPDACQPSVVNAIYYPRDQARRRAHDVPERVRVGSPRRSRVLLVQGPLALARRAPPARGLRIEAAALSHGDPPSAARLATWIGQRVHVQGRPEWVFVKVHAHGAPEKNARVMLGPPMASLHAALSELRSSGALSVHYVTAREMYNVARAAMDGMTGSPEAYFDYEVPPPERVAVRATGPSSARDRSNGRSPVTPGADPRLAARR
ncbi:MAG TPA: hypothetical protein VE987_09970 [Polyangiaceae bacterium]|nr:hypothetical protein [Polyangiaceae bacterium]